MNNNRICEIERNGKVHEFELVTGESYSKAENRFSYRWTDEFGKRLTRHADTLSELRLIEDNIHYLENQRFECNPYTIILNDLYEIWQEQKLGLYETSMQNYRFTYEKYLRNSLGKMQLICMNKHVIKKFYRGLYGLVLSNAKGESGPKIRNKTKTEAGMRSIPMTDEVYNALVELKHRQTVEGIKCECEIDGFTDFVFLNRLRAPHNQLSINRAIARILFEINMLIEKGDLQGEPIPYFTSHDIRHTFATRLAEANVNIKYAQFILGHTDIQTTMDIYTHLNDEIQREGEKFFRESRES